MVIRVRVGNKSWGWTKNAYVLLIRIRVGQKNEICRIRRTKYINAITRPALSDMTIRGLHEADPELGRNGQRIK